MMPSLFGVSDIHLFECEKISCIHLQRQILDPVKLLRWFILQKGLTCLNQGF